jgi:hypothetical protein
VAAVLECGPEVEGIEDGAEGGLVGHDSTEADDAEVCEHDAELSGFDRSSIATEHE